VHLRTLCLRDQLSGEHAAGSAQIFSARIVVGKNCWPFSITAMDRSTSTTRSLVLAGFFAATIARPLSAECTLAKLPCRADFGWWALLR
jgi:hypothetical protein